MVSKNYMDCLIQKTVISKVLYEWSPVGEEKHAETYS